MNYPSRLSRKQNQREMLQIVLTAGITITILLIFVFIGLPGLFTLSGKLIGLRNGQSGLDSEKSLAVVSKPILLSPFTATPSSSVKITGISDPDDNINLFANGQLLDNLVADSDGKFEADVPLDPGENKLTAQATNQKGVKSAMSEVITIFVLTKPPKLEIDNPKENQSFSNVDSIQIQGTTDVNATVLINGRSAIVGSDGKFSYFYRLSNGENTLKFEAIDQAGNKMQHEFKITSE